MNLIDFGGHFIQPHKMLTKNNNNHRMIFFVTIRDRCGVNAAANRRSRQYSNITLYFSLSRHQNVIVNHVFECLIDDLF